MAKIGILYLCTGRYSVFWDEFYRSAEAFLLNGKHEIHYFVFTDAESIFMEREPRVHKIYQEALAWPLTTLYRFKIFQSSQEKFEEMHALYFFNANMIFVDKVGEEILPEEQQPLVLLRHPLFYFKEQDDFTYERNPKSLAYIPRGQGEYYFMGALNGGLTQNYLSMIRELALRVDADAANGIIAIWHDESHLNRYALENRDKIKSLDPSYGYAEGRKLPFDKKILILDKSKIGGHAYLRGLEENSPWYKKTIAQIWRRLRS